MSSCIVPFIFPRTQIRRSAGTDSGWYYDRALFVIHSGYAQDSRGRATCTPLRNRIQAIKIMQLIAAVVGASAWEARQRHLTTAHSSIMAGFYELRITNHGLSLGLRCGVPPRQIQTNNDASGSPQRVAGRPPLLSVLITGSVSDGPERLWDGPYGIAVRRWK